MGNEIDVRSEPKETDERLRYLEVAVVSLKALVNTLFSVKANATPLEESASPDPSPSGLPETASHSQSGEC